MSNKYINDILKSYDKKRERAEEKVLINRQEVYKKIPRIKEIDAELSYMGFEIAKSIFKKDINIEVLIEQLKQKSIDLRMEKGELLSQNNMSIEYASPQYECKSCHDTGYIGSEKCNCLKQQLIDRYYYQSNLKHILSLENFDTFIFDYYSTGKFESEPLTPRKNIERIYSACVSFVHEFNNSKENLFFYGKSGLGKTFLSNCIAKDLLDIGKLVIYQTSSNLIEILKEAKFDADNESSRDKINDIYECDLLIIDDLGTEYLTDFSQMELFNIINRRLISQKKMIISTNLSLDNIYNTYPERITSRIFGNFTIFKFYGEDIRVKQAGQKRKKSRK